MLRYLPWGVAALVGLIPLFSQAAETAQFDVPPVVACSDVTTPSFVEQNPGERLWETRLNVSVLVPPNASSRLTQLLVRIDNPRRRLRVVDYSPHTSLTSDVRGSIRRDYHAESTKSFDFRVRAAWPGIGEGQATGSSNSRSTTDEKLERLPPLVLCVAAGSTNRGSGVYFKLHPTTQTTLEGSHELILWFAAPESWVGDHLRVVCEAFERSPSLAGVSSDDSLPSSKQSFVTAVYRAGDESGRSAAEALVRAEGELRWAVARQSPPIPVRRSGDFVGDWATRWTGHDSRVPSTWFQQLVYSAVPVDSNVYSRLPPNVRDAAKRYETAKRELVERQKS